MEQRIIAHLDMDAFFAAIEERNNSQFRGLPIVVGVNLKGGYGRGVVTTANYKAREYGIHSAMPITQAWRLSQTAKQQGSPTAIFLSGSYRRYTKTSHRIMTLIRTYSPLVQVRSIDEAYFDLSFAGSYQKATTLCQKLKNKIVKQEQLTASVGIGPNKLIAKIASDYQKPNGLTVVKEKNVEDFLTPLPIRVIPGIGPKTEIMFISQGIKTINDARRLTQSQLSNMLGRWGTALYEKFHGRGTTTLIEHEEPKSISQQTTFEIDTRKPHAIFGQLNKLCKNVYERLHQERFQMGSTLTVTVRFADFETHTNTRTAHNLARTLTTLHQEAIKLLLPYFDARKNPHRKPIRLIGVRVHCGGKAQ